MKNIIIGAIVGAVVGAGVSGVIVSANANKPAAKPAAAAQTAAKAQEKQKVVYHINYAGGEQGRLYRAALTNIQNHIDAVGAPNLDLKVVMHGLGLDILKDAKEDDDLKKRIGSLKNQHVAFQVCDIALTRRKIDYTKDMFDVSKDDIVPSGVAELARLQNMGYAYIKP